MYNVFIISYIDQVNTKLNNYQKISIILMEFIFILASYISNKLTIVLLIHYLVYVDYFLTVKKTKNTLKITRVIN